jgi:hypothetical protein
LASTPDIGPDWPPSLNVTSLPRTEIEIAVNISVRLMSFNSYLATFNSAIQLFDFCQTEDGRRIGGGWQFIAGRDGAMTIWHIGQSMQTIRARLNKLECPVLVDLIDFSHTREALRQFKASFPEFYDLRIAVAHSGEIFGDMEHAVKGPYSQMGLKINEGASTWFQSSFVGRSFVNTFEGKLLSYELSKASFDELNRIKKLFFLAFAGASEELAKRASSGAANPTKPA